MFSAFSFPILPFFGIFRIGHSNSRQNKKCLQSKHFLCRNGLQLRRSPIRTARNRDPYQLVRMAGLEPARLSTQEPKSCMSTNFITSARVAYHTPFRVKMQAKFSTRHKTESFNIKCERGTRPGRIYFLGLHTADHNDQNKKTEGNTMNENITVATKEQAWAEANKIFPTPRTTGIRAKICIRAELPQRNMA